MVDTKALEGEDMSEEGGVAGGVCGGVARIVPQAVFAAEPHKMVVDSPADGTCQTKTSKGGGPMGEVWFVDSGKKRSGTRGSCNDWEDCASVSAMNQEADGARGVTSKACARSANSLATVA